MESCVFDPSKCSFPLTFICGRLLQCKAPDTLCWQNNGSVFAHSVLKIYGLITNDSSSFQ